MPVKFQSSSEYQTKFAATQPIQMNKYAPIQMNKYAPTPTAGVKSELARTAMEPPIQRKKRVDGPQSTIPLSDAKLYQNGDDYYLLGANDKFVNNVKYRSKSMDRVSRKNKPSDDKENMRNGRRRDITPPTPLTPRPIDPPPKVRYDTGAPVSKTKKLTSKTTEVQTNGIEHTKTQPAQSRKSRSPKRKDAGDEGKPTKAQKKSSEPRVHVRAPEPENVVKSKSQPEQAPSDYAIKYKHGVAPPRVKGPKRLSEYAIQYKWREGVKSSPLLAAEQIVYKSNPSVAPFKAPMTKESEYNRAYKKWNMIKSADLQRGEQREERPSREKPKIKRTRSLEEIPTPDQLPAAGIEKKTQDEDKRLLKGTMNPQKPFFPHGKSKKMRSQYGVTYKAPQRYEYVDGAWVGAMPSHLEPKPESDSARGETPTNWFGEVLELRRKADEYKKRAQGTHFSREHVGQLYAKQNDTWDTVSESGSMVSALSLEVGSRVSSSRMSEDGRGSSTLASSRASMMSDDDQIIDDGNIDKHQQTQQKDATKNTTDVPRDEETQTRERKTRKQKIATKESKNHDNFVLSKVGRNRVVWTPLAGQHDHTCGTQTEDENVNEQVFSQSKGNQKSSAAQTSPDSTVSRDMTPRAPSPSISDDGTLVEDLEDDDVGRIPTPKLRQQKQISMRHHLDRTTPTSGGALLTSPPHQIMTPSEDSSWANISKQGTKARKSASAPAVQHLNKQPSRPHKHTPAAKSPVHTSPIFEKIKKKQPFGGDDYIDPVFYYTRAPETATIERTCSEDYNWLTGSLSRPSNKKKAKHKKQFNKKDAHTGYDNGLTAEPKDSYSADTAQPKDKNVQFRDTYSFQRAHGSGTSSVSVESAESSSVNYNDPYFPKDHRESFNVYDQRLYRANTSDSYDRRYTEEGALKDDLRKERKPDRYSADDLSANDSICVKRNQQGHLDITVTKDYQPDCDCDVGQEIDRKIQYCRDYLYEYKQEQAKKTRPPTYGMPTRDSHVLLDEDASTDRTLPMQYVHSPAKQDKLGTIREDGGATFKPQKPLNAWEVKLDDIPRRNCDDDDILSTSARSIASSCSLASEVLERARKNRDKFWKEQ